MIANIIFYVYGLLLIVMRSIIKDIPDQLVLVIIVMWLYTFRSIERIFIEKDFGINIKKYICLDFILRTISLFVMFYGNNINNGNNTFIGIILLLFLFGLINTHMINKIEKEWLKFIIRKNEKLIDEELIKPNVEIARKILSTIGFLVIIIYTNTAICGVVIVANSSMLLYIGTITLMIFAGLQIFLFENLIEKWNTQKHKRKYKWCKILALLGYGILLIPKYIVHKSGFNIWLIILGCLCCSYMLGVLKILSRECKECL